QYDQPICEHGKLEVEAGEEVREIRIRRIHMEEDAGKSVHDAAAGQSLVDLNRAGVPLLEIVSEPDLRSSEEAAEYMKSLRDILVYIEVNDGNLEEGSFRCDANVSLSRKGDTKLGTRAELKNINSFRFVRQAIDFEIARQAELLDAGTAVAQETRLWDAERGETRSMRSKEEANDYRYFPEPDLPPLRLDDALIERIRTELPELPRAKVRRFTEQYGLPAADAKILCGDRALADFYEESAKHYRDGKKLANWVLGELLRLQKESGALVSAWKLTPLQLAELLGEVERGSISANVGKDVLGEMFRTGKAAPAVIAEKGLAQVSDSGAIEAAVDEVLARSASEVASYRAGKTQVLGFLVGQVMRTMKGKGNPQRINEILRQKLSG
ncbi:MAG TPA: Asp-tRNA(Asn)/Glu-tRNA(Gln) amidotransferase subunit GatB, partial [Myxococcaceae bacterium]|nr:Asp-tRNA(Asn)/Glu-tRNA(Gln) amidotransferase subunit GatB [Myxococcaceae bacterium]